MVFYYNIDISLQPCATTLDQIAKIDTIINSLLTVGLTSVLNGDTAQYSLDTGQTKVMKTFNNPKAITDAIKEYRSIRQDLVNMITPRSVRLVDSKNFGYGR